MTETKRELLTKYKRYLKENLEYIEMSQEEFLERKSEVDFHLRKEIEVLLKGIEVLESIVGVGNELRGEEQ